MTAALYHLSFPQAVFDSPAASILIPVALGTAVGYSSRPPKHDPSFTALKQPPFRPPPAVFGPVWTILYGVMGYAAHRALSVSGRPGQTRTLGAALYTVQLGLNLAWMPLFYELRQPVLATIDSVALLGINSYLAQLWFTEVDELAGWLLVPYVAWLSFATYLSAGTGYLNNWTIGGQRVGK